jgi:hypothetical protein
LPWDWNLGVHDRAIRKGFDILAIFEEEILVAAN